MDISNIISDILDIAIPVIGYALFLAGFIVLLFITGAMSVVQRYFDPKTTVLEWFKYIGIALVLFVVSYFMTGLLVICYAPIFILFTALSGLMLSVGALKASHG